MKLEIGSGIPNFAKKALERLAERVVEEVSQTVVTVMERKGDGKLVIAQQWGKKLYSSEFWASQPDGEYQLFMTQGGIRNREIPREEKEALSRLWRHYLPSDEGGNKIFAGLISLDVFNGAITQVRIQPK